MKTPLHFKLALFFVALAGVFAYHMVNADHSPDHHGHTTSVDVLETTITPDSFPAPAEGAQLAQRRK